MHIVNWWVYQQEPFIIQLSASVPLQPLNPAGNHSNSKSNQKHQCMHIYYLL